MIKFFDISLVFAICCILVMASDVYSSEKLLEADVDARAEYDDNIFLTTGPHDAVSGLTVTPSLSGIIKEENWEAKLRARLRASTYSDHSIDGNDQFFDLTGQYNAQRNIFSLNVNHDLDSNLSSTSTDFGISGRRVDRKNQNVTPQYTRLLTERLSMALSYTYTNVDFSKTKNSGFTPFSSQSGSASLQYAMTEKDQLSSVIQLVDYKSNNGLQTFQLLTSRLSIDHKFSEVLSADVQLGVSRRSSTNRDNQPFVFFGQLITREVESDVTTRGLVVDAGMTKKLENGSIKGRLSRNNATNSFGGLDQIDKLSVIFADKLSLLWRYDISTRFSDIKSISTNNRSTDRSLFFFESRLYYSISPKWSANASYRYAARRFKSNSSGNRTPDSNRIYVGLTYNFPSLSTF